MADDNHSTKIEGNANKAFHSDAVAIETATREIGNTKSAALTEIDAEVKRHKESIRLLISTANEISDKLEDINRVLPMVILDPRKRAQWIQQLRNICRREIDANIWLERVVLKAAPQCGRWR